VYARSHGDDTDAVMAGGTNVCGSVTDGADFCVRAGKVASPLESAAIDIGAVLQTITEGRKVEEIQETAGLELDSTDRSEISGGNAENGFAAS
jgi:hypothetical protein